MDLATALCVLAINLAGFALTCILGRRVGVDLGLREARDGARAADQMFQEAEERTIESDFPDTAITPMVVFWVVWLIAIVAAVTDESKCP